MNIQKPKSKQPIPPEAKRVFKGVIFDVYQWEQKQFDGSIKTWEKLKRADTTNVIAITKEKKLLLLEQEQPGLKKMFSLPGGRVDEGYDPFAQTKKELLEETGFTSENFTLYDSEQLIEKIDMAYYTFIAKDCIKVTEQNLDAGERIEVMEVDFNEFVDIVFSEDFRDFELTLRLAKDFYKPDGKERFKELLFT